MGAAAHRPGRAPEVLELTIFEVIAVISLSSPEQLQSIPLGRQIPIICVLVGGEDLGGTVDGPPSAPDDLTGPYAASSGWPDNAMPQGPPRGHGVRGGSSALRPRCPKASSKSQSGGAP